jgi:rhodanese-related sulfurtransferase
MDRYIEFALNHYILSLALLIVTYLLIQEFFDTAFKKFVSISPLLAVAKMNNTDTLLIDVREVADFVQTYIEQSTNVPLSKFPDIISTLTEHQNKPVLIICQNGISSAAAAKKLSNAGFEQLFVITGGLAAWEGDYKLPVKIAKKNYSKK